jgi:carbonic anhydrase
MSQTAVVGGAELELLQYHFHTPSEHAFDGERTAMEVHLVHRNIVTGGFLCWGGEGRASCAVIFVPNWV